MGFWHTDATYDDFHSGTGCPGDGRPERVRVHAAVMYARPAGNSDVDRDSGSTVHPASASAGGEHLVSCYLEGRMRRW
jgi:hypothetical protein